MEEKVTKEEEVEEENREKKLMRYDTVWIQVHWRYQKGYCLCVMMNVACCIG